jgi:CRP-like cAMP-binding protein
MDKSVRNYDAESFLGRLELDTLDRLEQVWQVSRFEPESMMIAEDDSDQDVWFLLEGEGKAAVYTESGREVSFISLKAGDCFGEFAAIDHQPRSSSVVATRQSLAASIPAAEFRRVIQNDSKLAFSLLEVLVARLRSMNLRVTEYSDLSAKRRVALAYLRMAKANRFADDKARISPAPNQQELAGHLATNRETVSRVKKTLEKLGLIQKEAKGILVPSIKAFEAKLVISSLN